MTQTRRECPSQGRGRCHVHFRGAVVLGFLAAAFSVAPSATAEVRPAAPPPAITVTPLDNAVRVSWPRQADSLLVAVGVPDGGLDQWSGASLPFAGGLFEGHCDQDYSLQVRRGELAQGRLVLQWDRSPPESLSVPGQIEFIAANQLMPLNDGILVGLTPSNSLYVAPADIAFGDSLAATFHFTGRWNGAAAPRDWGLWLRQGENGVFVFTAPAGGTVSAGGTTPDSLHLDWSYYATDPDSAERTGSIVIPRADFPVDVDFDSVAAPGDTVRVRALRMEFGAGTVVAADSFAVGVRPSVVARDREDIFVVTGRSFEGYAIWRSEVIDLDRPIYIGKIRRCDAPAESSGFFDQDSLSYVDTEAHNGFPYYYAVTTSDAEIDSIPLTCAGSDTVCWNYLRKKAYPRGVDETGTVSRFTDARQARAVPNPYKVAEDWEEGDSKMQFINLPPEATVYIYTESGDFVTSIRQTDPRSDRVDWNLRNGHGRKVVSGIYMFKVESPHGDKTGRFVVIR